MNSSAVIVLIFNAHRDHVLLIQRRDVPVWALPGGGIEAHENPPLAALREAEEETGLHCKIKRQTALYTPLNKLAKLTYVYECEPVDGELRSSSETKQAVFFPINSLPKSFFFLHHLWLQDALRNEPQPIRRPISEVTYMNLVRYFFRHPIHVSRMLLSRLGWAINS